ncbi:kinetochore protein NDC80 homolog isoform X2 [Pseudomyrmex gracilis]|nr:kinetochore protein NDC80 homolog isoform X2 [Pseudomyrmex gracilis]XP_020277846.1 kinetochore protein NDC80 homolog isoform X2 [Pseudomyrmex gracilis]XP_020277847.1 kinetochore protein NDC80 homolog isoform X2 [Pseudomyrmex gracilis]XP_020277848.1 kinetochore protein NDC80 homolog isoform X2 [Pseudomyrmex gracilis]
MYSNSIGRSSSAGRISMFEREDRNLLRNEQRRTHTLKKGSNENSHIPRPRFRSSSSDRAGSLGRKSYLKITGKTPLLHLPTTPVTPARASRHNLLSLGLTASSSKNHVSMSRSPSAETGASFLGNKGPKKDRRTLIDKTYQAELLNKIDNYFCVNECSGMLNNGSFKSVTLKMFVEVTSFLLKFFDIKQELTLANYIEELPKCAKKLHYPGMINKSWLKTANTMHSYPHVLGWVGWLVEACQIKEIAFEKYQLETLPFIGFEEQIQSSKIEFLTFLDCYNAWTEENLNEEEEILEKYFKDIMIQQGITEEDIAQAHAKVEDEISLLHMIEKESQEIDEETKQLQKELSLLDAKEAKLMNDIKSKEDCMKKISFETNLLNTEYDTLNEQVRTGNLKREELISIVKSQPMSKAEKEVLVQKCTELQNYVHEFDEHLNDYKKELYNLDIKLAFINNNLNKAILEYNKEVFMLIDKDADVNFDELRLPEKGLLDPQIMIVLEEKVALTKTFRELLAKRCNEIESVIRSNATKIEKLQEKINLLPDDDKLKEEKSRIDQMKMDTKKEKEKITKQIENVKTDINKIQDMMPDIKAIDLEIEEVKDKLDAVTRRKTFLQQNAARFFGELYTIIGDHRKELKDILTKYKNSTWPTMFNTTQPSSCNVVQSD